MYRYARDYGRGYDSGYGRGFRGGRGGQGRPYEPYDRSFGGARGAWGYPGSGASARGEEIGYRMGGRRGRGQTRYGGDFGRGSGADMVRAADIMTRNPEAVTPDTPIADVARRMRDLDTGVIPVIASEESQLLEGIVTDRDIAVRGAAEGKDLKKTAIREIMSSRPRTVSENDHVRDVFAVMKRARVRRVPVTGADGALVGIIAQADLAVHYAGLDLQRETEVEEVIEKISEPARPRWGREGAPQDSRDRMLRRFTPSLDVALPDRVRSGWRALRREARGLVGRRYDGGWR